MKFSDTEYDKIFKKLEYTFKKSDNPLINKLKNKEDLSIEDLKLLIRKLEYTFRKSDDEIIKKISELTDEPPVKFSNLKQQKKKSEREKLKHLKEYNDFISDNI